MTKCSIKEADFDLLTISAPTMHREAIAAGKANEEGPYWVWEKLGDGSPNPNYWGGERFSTAKGFKVVLTA